MDIETILAKERLKHPVYRWEPDFDPTISRFEGIRALTYDSLTVSTGKTQVFAYIGFPEHAEGEQVPGIVLVHGGGGHPYLPWVDMWRKRGYAAIAMDTTGFFPNGRNAGALEAAAAQYEHGLHGSFVRDGYVTAPGNDAMGNSDAPLEEQWMTHALASIINAHNVLRSFPEVDRSRVGITGISWGGVSSSMAIGHDPRYAFAIPVYGSGYLDHALTNFGKMLHAEGNIRSFRAEDRFKGVRMPVLWLAWDDDNNFTVTSNSLSYRDTYVNNHKTVLALTNGMLHSHVNGWAPEIIMTFADSIVRGGTPLPEIPEQPTGLHPKIRVNVPQGVRVIRAKGYFIDEPMSYAKREKYGFVDGWFMKQDWQSVNAEYADGVLSADFPENTAGYYIALEVNVDGADCWISTEYIELK